MTFPGATGAPRTRIVSSAAILSASVVELGSSRPRSSNSRVRAARRPSATASETRSVNPCTRRAGVNCVATCFTLRLAIAVADDAGEAPPDEPRHSLIMQCSFLAAQPAHGPGGARGQRRILITGVLSAAAATRPPPPTASLIASAEPSTRSNRSRSSRASSTVGPGIGGRGRSSTSSGPVSGAARHLAAQRRIASSTRTSTTIKRGEAEQHSTAASRTRVRRPSFAFVHSPRHPRPASAPWLTRLVVLLVAPAHPGRYCWSTQPSG